MKQKKDGRPRISPDVEDIVEVFDEPASADAGKSTADREERRKHRRLQAAQNVVLESATGRIVADLVDLSSEGARLRILNGIVPKKGTAVSIALLDGTTLKGSVSWTAAHDFGVSLGNEIGDVEDLLSFEDLGEAYFSKALSLQKRLHRR